MDTEKIKYSTAEEFEIFEKQSVYFDELRNNHHYWGGNSIKEMIDFCLRNNLDVIKDSLVSLQSLTRLNNSVKNDKETED